MRSSQDERFHNKLSPEPMSGCWLWTGSIDSHNYGQFFYNGKTLLAHRASWMMFRGSIGAMCVLHRCDNSFCVNPDHLFLGTKKDNSIDMMRKGRNSTVWTSDVRPSIVARGEASAASILTEMSVIEARMLRKQGVPARELASRYGISKVNMLRAIRGATWAHVREGL